MRLGRVRGGARPALRFEGGQLGQVYKKPPAGGWIERRAGAGPGRNRRIHRIPRTRGYHAGAEHGADRSRLARHRPVEPEDFAAAGCVSEQGRARHRRSSRVRGPASGDLPPCGFRCGGCRDGHRARSADRSRRTRWYRFLASRPMARNRAGSIWRVCSIRIRQNLWPSAWRNYPSAASWFPKSR